MLKLFQVVKTKWLGHGIFSSEFRFHLLTASYYFHHSTFNKTSNKHLMCSLKPPPKLVHLMLLYCSSFNIIDGLKAFQWCNETESSLVIPFQFRRTKVFILKLYVCSATTCWSPWSNKLLFKLLLVINYKNLKINLDSEGIF